MSAEAYFPSKKFLDSGCVYIAISLSVPILIYQCHCIFFWGVEYRYEQWIYREGIRVDDRTDQITYSDPKCQPGKYFEFNVSTPWQVFSYRCKRVIPTLTFHLGRRTRGSWWDDTFRCSCPDFKQSTKFFNVC